jgi:L-amino acid N-acyltransferase
MNARTSALTIRDATWVDAAGILPIYNHAVAHTTAIWNETLVDLPNREQWLSARLAQGYPVLVAEDPARPGDILGYATFGDWRTIEGFRRTVEHSVYVRTDAHRRGIGEALMLTLIDRARALGKHVMVAAIEAGNAPSIALHQRLGFQQTALMPEVGCKFGRWLDLAFLQLKLDTGSAD